MAEKLHLKQLLFIICTPVICFSVAQLSYGQVSLTATESFEVYFVANETHSTERSKEIGINDPSLRSFIGTNGSSISRFSNQTDDHTGYYFVEIENNVSIGSYYQNQETPELISISLLNETNKSLSELSVAFDFVYMAVQQEQNFQLSYRVNNGSWKQPAGGAFSTDYLQSTEEGWNTFAIQISMDELFIRNDDTIEFKWTTTLNDTDRFFPIALQKIEVHSTQAKQQSIKRGSLVISEILPNYTRSGSSIEYIELYNITENTISLKGMTLKSGEGEVVIQENIDIPPYDVVVLGNKQNFNDLPIELNYQYSESLLNRRGRVNVVFDDVTIAAAMYESIKPGVSLEMNHLSEGINGYSSMSSLEEAATEISQSIFGSPGRVDESKRVYQKNISNDGWHFIYPLGELQVSDRNLRSAMYGVARNLELTNSSNAERSDTEALFVHVDDNQPVTLYSNGKTVQPAVQPKTGETSRMPFRLLGNPLSISIGIDQIVSGDNFQVSPAIMAWNTSAQKFTVLYKEDDLIEPWSGIILPYSLNEISFLENRSEAKSSFSDSFISFSLMEEGDRNSFKEVDNGAVVGFTENRNIAEGVRTDLPKLKLEDDDLSDQSFIYLRSNTSDYETNSFLQFPKRFEDPLQIGIGVNVTRGNHNYRIAWNRIANVPDEWVVELVDTDTDQVINMREESHYTFRSQNTLTEHGMNTDRKFLKTVGNNSNKNLFIRVSPHKMTEEIVDRDERSESVNLKQNYPNPFNPATTISFYVPENSFVRLAVYNVVGHQVAILREENVSNGEHSVVWNASEMPSGIYIVKLETQQNVLTRKITLIK